MFHVLRSMTVEIRTWDPALAAHFGRLNREWIQRLFELEPADEEILADPGALIEAGGEIVFAMAGDEVVGTAGLQKLDEHTVELVKMAVTPAWQSRGIGGMMLAELIAVARRRDFACLYIETNSSLAPSNRLYQKYGFKSTGQTESRHSYARADIFYELIL